MISYILSVIFRFCFVLALIGGLTSIGAQLMQKPMHLKTGKRSFWTFGEPGLKVTAFKNNNLEETAPDTTVNYTFRDSVNMTTASGTIKLGEKDFFNNGKGLDQLIASKKGSPGKLEIDTAISIIGQWHDSDYIAGLGTAKIELRDDSSVSYSTEELVPGKNKAGSQPIIFKDLRSANKYRLYQEFEPVNKIYEENNNNGSLRIMPADRWQQIGFILNDIIRFGCLALLFFCLGRLFSNFSKKRFFTHVNIRLLKRTGWLLLIPSMAAALLYWIFLEKIRPVKLVFQKDPNPFPISSYSINAGIDWTLILLGAGLLVLGYIFAGGLELKEENDQIV